MVFDEAEIYLHCKFCGRRVRDARASEVAPTILFIVTDGELDGNYIHDGTRVHHACLMRMWEWAHQTWPDGWKRRNKNLFVKVGD